MILVEIFNRFLCRVRGHRERRLRKSEITPGLFDGFSYRICDHCGRLRAVQKRKKASEDTQ